MITAITGGGALVLAAAQTRVEAGRKEPALLIATAIASAAEFPAAPLIVMANHVEIMVAEAHAAHANLDKPVPMANANVLLTAQANHVEIMDVVVHAEHVQVVKLAIQTGNVLHCLTALQI